MATTDQFEEGGFKQPTRIVGGEAECPMCKLIRETYKGFGPSHNGSKNCESGSIASGGKNAHCTCDTCF